MKKKSDTREDDMHLHSKKDRDLLRRNLLKQRDQLAKNEREAKDRQLRNRLLASTAIMQFSHFFIYCSYRTEVDTRELIDHVLGLGKSVSVPLTNPQTAGMDAVLLRDPALDLVAGFKGIPEPRATLVPERLVDPGKIEVVLLPGSVFDTQGNRLGYGGGYYDRFLESKAPQALKVGLAYAFQVVEVLPTEPHDIPMDYLITESEVLNW